tara:strand:- start:1777 stop:2052 length:276 start_codon:yes stop_codon:yes gene_type:complete
VSAGKVQKELTAGEHTIRGVGWGVIWTIVMLVLGYMIVPLSASVDKNEDQLNDIDIRVTVLESKITEGFSRIEKKLDQIDEKMEKLNVRSN